MLSSGWLGADSLVTTYIDGIAGVVPPPGSSAEVACDHILDFVMQKLETAVCTKAKAAAGIPEKVCDLVFEKVSDAFQPVRNLVSELCTTVLQSFIESFGLASDLDELFGILTNASIAVKKDISSMFCGASVCAAGNQSACATSVNPKSNKTILAAIIDDNQGNTSFTGVARVVIH